MNVFGLGLAFLRRRWGQGLSAVVAGALGIAMIQTVLIAQRELPKAAERAFGGVDVVVGPKGSALDLVLCCVLHVTDPVGLVPLAGAMEALSNPLVKAKAPLALGDSVHGIRIVGTTADLLSVYGAVFAQGGMWTGPSQAVVGAQAAKDLGVKIGDGFVGSHGLAEGGEEHAEFPYKVVGVLAPTGSGLDRLVLTGIETVWTIHHHHEAEEAEQKGQAPPPATPPAATVLVASVKSPVALAQLPRRIDAGERFTAAVPAFESARLMRAARPVAQAVLGVGVLFALVAALTATAVLAAAMAARVRDLALLRVLGAHPWELAAIALVEAAVLSLAALAAGEGLFWAFAPRMAAVLAQRDGLLISISPASSDIVMLVAGTACAGVIAALFPAVRALGASIETVLSP